MIAATMYMDPAITAMQREINGGKYILSPFWSLRSYLLLNPAPQ